MLTPCTPPTPQTPPAGTTTTPPGRTQPPPSRRGTDHARTRTLSHMAQARHPRTPTPGARPVRRRLLALRRSHRHGSTTRPRPSLQPRPRRTSRTRRRRSARRSATSTQTMQQPTKRRTKHDQRDNNTARLVTHDVVTHTRETKHERRRHARSAAHMKSNERSNRSTAHLKPWGRTPHPGACSHLPVLGPTLTHQFLREVPHQLCVSFRTPG